MPKLLYQGHASFRLIADNGAVVYIDPFAGEGYTYPADIILVTHQHKDHNRVDLVPKKSKCRIITEEEAQTNGIFNSFRIRRINIRAVPAFNEHHDPREGVGYVITVDGIKLYHAGDTSETDAMGEMVWQKLDYAMLPVDGVYNMDPVHASICAARIGASRSIPMHTKPGELFSMDVARRFDVPSRMIMQPGEEVELESHW